MLAVVGVGISLLMLLGGLILVLQARAVAQTAADLGAVAAATARHTVPVSAPCLAAQRALEGLSATLSACTVVGEDVVVSVSVATRFGPAVASARAGPVTVVEGARDGSGP